MRFYRISHGNQNLADKWMLFVPFTSGPPPKEYEGLVLYRISHGNQNLADKWMLFVPFTGAAPPKEYEGLVLYRILHGNQNLADYESYTYVVIFCPVY